MSSARLFHSFGPAKQNDRSPIIVARRDGRTANIGLVVEHIKQIATNWAHWGFHGKITGGLTGCQRTELRSGVYRHKGFVLSGRLEIVLGV